MAPYYLPAGMRYSTLEEREEFYSNEFKPQNVPSWFQKCIGKIKFAVIMGRHTKIFLEKYREDASTTIIIDEYTSFEDLRCQVLEFLPEAVYYDRNTYNDNDQVTGQELAFDLDPENITCPVHGSLADKMKQKQGLSFCEIELDLIKNETIRLHEYLEDFFSDLRVVYSGRGFHIHIMDKEAYDLNAKERLDFAEKLKHMGFHIDEWVTSGEYRLIRLPYSLNGIVSRIALPLKKEEIEKFDAVHDPRCVPKFLDKTIS
jgi:DNA primase catalytic subunit